MFLRAFSTPRKGTPGRRAALLAVIALVVGAPPALLVALCPGDICNRASEEAVIPFCSLSEPLRQSLLSGYRDGRSPDVFVVGGDTIIRGGSLFPEGEGPVWPAVSSPRTGLPLAFWGRNVNPEGSLPDRPTLDSVAPTLADIAVVQRPHPEVRSGEALTGVPAGSDPPSLLVLIVWKEASAADLRSAADRWPELRSAFSSGASTIRAGTGSLPGDPGALLATIGTGGLPRQHGITGATVRNDSGRMVQAWSKRAPVSIIAALGDDLDEMSRLRARVGVVGTRRYDRGLIGGNWYVQSDRDDVRKVGGGTSANAQARTVEELLSSGYGDDDVTDLLAVAFQGQDIEALDRATARITQAAEDASGGSVAFAFAGTGGGEPEDSVTATELTRSLESELGANVVAASAVGGFFLDQDAMLEEGFSEDTVVQALRSLPALRGGDVFSARAVQFARYC